MSYKLYDFECENCKKSMELLIEPEELSNQSCGVCGTKLRRLFTAKPQMAFTPHYSDRLGVYIENRKQESEALNEIRNRCEV